MVLVMPAKEEVMPKSSVLMEEGRAISVLYRLLVYLVGNLPAVFCTAVAVQFRLTFSPCQKRLWAGFSPSPRGKVFWKGLKLTDLLWSNP